MNDSIPWCILQARYGESFREPTQSQLEAVAHELFHEDILDMTIGDYEEHGAASLRYGFDDGPLYEIEASRIGEVNLAKYADPDYNDHVGELIVPNVTEDSLLQLWRWLATGDIDRIKQACPNCGW